MSALASAKFANAKTYKNPAMETVVLNSIIYSKPSSCTMEIDMSDDLTTFRKGTIPRFDSTFPNFHGTNVTAPSPSAEATTHNGSINHQITDVGDRHLADNSFMQYNYNVDKYFCVDDVVETEISPMDIDDDIECPNVFLPKPRCDKKKKKVHFDMKPTVHILHKWNYAYRKARESNWKTYTPLSICDNEEDIDLRMPKNNNDVFSLECLMENLPKLRCDKKKKKVHFASKPTVHVLHTWNYAYRKARQSDWRIMSYLHRIFNERIEITAEFLNPILNRYHRQKIYEDRFANFNDKDEMDIFQQPAKRRKLS